MKNSTNYLMDWDNQQDRINYFRNLRKFLSEIKEVIDDLGKINDFGESLEWKPDKTQLKILTLFAKWNVYFIDVDEIPRVNLDEPIGKL